MNRIAATVWALTAIATVLPEVGQAQPNTLPPGNAERAQMMDAMRPIAEKDLGSPLEFVVKELTVSGDWAFVNAGTQYKGGGKIKWVNTPYFAKLGRKSKSDVENSLSVLPDCCMVQAILHKTDNGLWVVTEQNDAATDVWWESYCDKPARVAIQKYCGQP